MWKALFDSVRGTSHDETGSPCQDACRVIEVASGGAQYLIATCADGAGSAAHADLGAALACDAFVDIASERIRNGGISSDFSREDALSWCDEIRVALLGRADELETSPRELACTMLGAILSESVAVFLQIGDGAMVVGSAGGYVPVFWPQTGEYANTTNFLTDENYSDKLAFSVGEPVTEFAAFTDGLERLVLHFADRAVHAPFLVPLFDAMRSADDVEPYFESLRQFLSSERVNERTNDDKTLILATRAIGECHVGKLP